MNIVRIPGTKYIALGDDKNLTPEAAKYRTIVLEHHIRQLDVVRSLRASDCVIDVGAFIGDTALIFLEYTPHVYAFEPQEDAFFCLEYNSHHSANFNVAVGDGSKVSCNQDAMDGNMGTRTVRLDPENGKDSVKLDSLVFYPLPTLIKIDCEGSEVLVLDGAKKLIEYCAPKLLIEVYPEMMAKHGFVADDLYNRLRAFGYGYEPVIGNPSEPRWDILAAKTL